MTKLQLGLVISSLVLVLAMYFGCETKPPKQQEIERIRQINAESTGIEALEKEAKDTLKSANVALILALERELKNAQNDTAKIDILKKMSATWYQFSRPDIAGHFAEKVAELEQSELAWSLAGTTFHLCIQKMEVDKIKNFCTQKAVLSFENAISINPENVDHQVNLALCYTENPPKENPMKGILILRDLGEKHPDNYLVLSNLGRLAIMTNQFEKAKQRLEKALTIAPQSRDIICMLAQTYSALNETENATAFNQRCNEMN